LERGEGRSRGGQLLQEILAVGGAHGGGLGELTRGVRFHRDLFRLGGESELGVEGLRLCELQLERGLELLESGEIEGEGVLTRGKEREDVIAVGGGHPGGRSFKVRGKE